MKTLNYLIMSALCLSPLVASADFKTICRGANIPRLDKVIKLDVMAKLEEQGVAFKNVSVKFVSIKRATGTYGISYKDSLTVGAGSTPLVTFSGAFNDPTACEVEAKLRIRVNYGDGAISSTVVDVKVPGSMLFKGGGD